MKYFGPCDWAPEGCENVLTPDGAVCSYCDEAIREGDYGVVASVVENMKVAVGGQLAVELCYFAEHQECMLRQVVGSVGHQKHLCSCDGGPGLMDDPPGMTLREAARAALRLFRAHHCN